MIERLLTADEDEADIRWLFSNVDEYTPSGLTGRPIPAPALPQRGQGTPRVWDPRWHRFGIGNFVLTGTAIVAAGAAIFIPPRSSPWQKRNGLDEWGQETFGSSDYDGRLWARDVSDLLVSVNITFPLLVDSLITLNWYRKSPDVAGQTALIAVESLAVSMAVQSLVSSLASRERPFVRNCGETIPESSDDCQSRDRYRSFFSGHTSNAFTGAAVTCSNHVHHQVFGTPLADALTCAVAFTSAGTVGMMRVMGERHYLTDVMTGALIGTVTGFGVPWLLHYRGAGADSASSERRVTLLPLPNGLAIGGPF